MIVSPAWFNLSALFWASCLSHIWESCTHSQMWVFITVFVCGKFTVTSLESCFPHCFSYLVLILWGLVVQSWISFLYILLIQIRYLNSCWSRQLDLWIISYLRVKLTYIWTTGPMFKIRLAKFWVNVKFKVNYPAACL